MRNEDLIEKFCNGSTTGRGSNLYIDNNKLVNYSTTIAQRTSDGVILNATKYSRTTSKLQNYVRHYGHVTIELHDLNYGVHNLSDYTKSAC